MKATWLLSDVSTLALSSTEVRGISYFLDMYDPSDRGGWGGCDKGPGGALANGTKGVYTRDANFESWSWSCASTRATDHKMVSSSGSSIQRWGFCSFR